MNVEQLREFALSLPHATEDMPFGDDWITFRIGGKIFLFLRLDIAPPTCAVKLPPGQGTELRESHEGINPAYHLNKVHWSDLTINTLETELVKELILKSYSEVRRKLPRKVKEAITEHPQKHAHTK